MSEAADDRPARLSGLSRAGGKGVFPFHGFLALLAGFVGGLRRAAADAFERRRLFVLWPFLLITGILSYSALPSEPDRATLFAVMTAIAAGAAFSRNSIVMLRLLLVVTGLWLGLCLLPFHGMLSGTWMLDYPVFGTYSAHVDTVLRRDGESSTIIVSGITPHAGSDDAGVRRARLFVRQNIPLAPGDRIAGRMRFAPVPGPVIPGGFDSQFHGYFDGIGAFGNTLAEISVVPAEPGNLQRFADGVRQEIARRVDAVLRQPAAGIARALIIGDQSLISDDTRDVMAAAGLAHVLAISGLHLTLVAGGVFFIVRALLALSYTGSQLWPIKRLAAGTGIAIALVYLVLSGASVSATRATIMLVLVFGAVIAGRRALTMRNVAVAALFVLLTAPESVFRPGFQLSFGAVVALIGAYEMTRRTGRDDGWLARFAGYFKGLVATSAIAGGATALFAAYHFQQTAPLGIIGNVLALPFVGFVVLPAAFFSVLAMPLGMEPLFLHIMGWGIERIVGIATLVTGWSHGVRASPMLTPAALIFGLAGFAWFAFFCNRYRYAGPLAALALIAGFCVSRPPDVLIADTTKAVAVRGADGLALISGRTGSFATDVWSETYQEPILPRFESLACDAAACIAHSPRGFTVSLVVQPRAFWEDCYAVDLIITRLYAPKPCRSATVVVDRSDLDRSGVQWLRWDAAAGVFERRRAITDPERPWRPQ